MAIDREALRDWHRLFGLLLTDFFTGSPFTVEIERDLSQQQQFLDVVIVRGGQGEFAEPLPDGLDGLTAHNLISFKSHHEALDGWAMRELVGHYVAYRKLVSPSPSRLVPEDHFRLYTVCARFPHNLSGQVPWQQLQPGVYDCHWGMDAVRVVVAGELPQEAHNAPLHLFSASPELVGFGQGSYRQRSARTSRMLKQLFQRYKGENLIMPYTWADFERDYFKEYFPQLTAEERQEVLESLSPDEQCKALERLPPERLGELLQVLKAQKRRAVIQSLPPEERREILQSLIGSLPPEELREFLQSLSHSERANTGHPTKPRKQRRKK